MSFACPRTRLANEQPGLVVLCSSLREGKGSRARGMLVVRIFSGTQCVGTAACSLFALVLRKCYANVGGRRRNIAPLAWCS